MCIRDRYYTVGNPFACEPFQDWAGRAGLARATVLEPFAGRNSLIERLEELGLCSRWRTFDILPGAPGVVQRDSLVHFPTGFDVCITNPPWLAKNSATARGLAFPNSRHDDLYKFALEKCLHHCPWVAALVPESFIRAGLFQRRLESFVSLTGAMFSDTDHPVGLALFTPEPCADVMVWSGQNPVGSLAALRDHLPKARTRQQRERRRQLRFNDPEGNLGLIALDNTRGPSIRFCPPEELEKYCISHSSRALTRIHVPFSFSIRDCNRFLHGFRDHTRDVLLTCYRGLRQDGMYRRRLDWGLAREIVAYV